MSTQAAVAATCVASAANVGWYGGPWTDTCTGSGYGGAAIPGAADDVVINSGSQVRKGINSQQDLISLSLQLPGTRGKSNSPTRLAKSNWAAALPARTAQK